MDLGGLNKWYRQDRVETGVAPVRSAYAAMTGGGTGDGGRPEYRQFLPVDWHEHAGMRAHRGNGYADELLEEATHLLAEDGATEITAATDGATLRWRRRSRAAGTWSSTG
jgi:hypothetical protein